MEVWSGMDALVTVDAPRVEPSHPGVDVSEAIRIARVVSIFFMIFVHVNPADADFTNADGIRAFDVLRFFFVDSLGRASVALLSVIAGYLAVHSLRRQTYRTFTRKKAQSLLLPLVLWNVIFIAMGVLGGSVSPGYAEQALEGSISLSRIPELVLSLYGTPANEPLAFLRDVFVCALLTPALILAIRRSTPAFVALVTALTVAGSTTPLLMTPSILVLFAAGVMVGEGKLAYQPGRRLAIGAWAVFFGLGALITWRDLTLQPGDDGGRVLLEAGFNAIRLPAAIAFWALALQLRAVPLGRGLSRLEPYVFTAFCSHLIVSTIVWAGWQHVFGGYYDPAYPLFFFGVPVLIMLSAVVGARTLDRLAPWLFGLLNGGRGLPRGAPVARARASWSGLRHTPETPHG